MIQKFPDFRNYSEENPSVVSVAMEGYLQSVDPSKMNQMLEQMLLDLETSFGSAPSSLMQLATNTTFSVYCLQNSLKFEFSKHVAQLARDGNPDGAAEALTKFFPHLKTANVEEILHLVYVEGSDDLQVAIAFVEKLSDGYIRQDAYEALYQKVRFQGHTELPEMLLLQKSMRHFQARDEMMKQVDEDCIKIVDLIVDVIRAKNYPKDNKFVSSLLRTPLNQEINAIVEKVHAAGTLEETLLLIAFFQELEELSNCCQFVQSLYKVLESKQLLETENGMHLWAHAKSIVECDKFTDATENVKEQCISVCNELGRKKKLILICTKATFGN